MFYSLLAVFYFLLMSYLFVLFLRKKNKQRIIRQWQKTLNLAEHAKIFHQLYQDVNGFLLSHQARQTHDALDYVYGEVEFLSFLALLSLIKPNEKTVFYDLGCGTGKAVIACAMTYRIHKCAGVEILPELYECACKQVSRLAQTKNYATKAAKITILLDDFLKANLDDATLIFINSTGLFDPTWGKLCERLARLPQLQTVITTSKSLPEHHFSIIAQTPVTMSWGVVTAYIHARKKNSY